MAGVASEDVVLELTLTLAQQADANHVLGKVVQLVESLHAYEQALGGGAWQWDKKRSVAGHGTVQVVLVSNRPAEDDDRWQALGELVRATVAEFKDVQTACARLSSSAA
jgi:hypothetical protein